MSDIYKVQPAFVYGQTVCEWQRLYEWMNEWEQIGNMKNNT